MHKKQQNQKYQFEQEIPQLVRLQKQIRQKRPNDIMKFIRSWATQHFAYNHISTDQEQQQNFRQIIKNKNKKRKRRNAVIGYVKQQKQDKQKKDQSVYKNIQKSEQSKSIIMILLKQLKILSVLQDDNLIKLADIAQINKYANQKIIFDKGVNLQKIFIIINGKVLVKQKQIILQPGQSFGQESILYQLKSQVKYIAQGKVQLAQINSLIIWKMIRQQAQKKYKLIISSLSSIQIFNNLDNQELDKITNLAMSDKGIFTSPNEQIIKQDQSQNFFIIAEGQFGQYSRKLTGILKKQPMKKLLQGDAFGIQILRGNRNIDYTIVSHSYGKILRFRKIDIERLIGQLIYVQKRKRKQKIY